MDRNKSVMFFCFVFLTNGRWVKNGPPQYKATQWVKDFTISRVKKQEKCYKCKRLDRNAEFQIRMWHRTEDWRSNHGYQVIVSLIDWCFNEKLWSTRGYLWWTHAVEYPKVGPFTLWSNISTISSVNRLFSNSCSLASVSRLYKSPYVAPLVFGVTKSFIFSSSIVLLPLRSCCDVCIGAGSSEKTWAGAGYYHTHVIRTTLSHSPMKI